LPHLTRLFYQARVISYNIKPGQQHHASIDQQHPRKRQDRDPTVPAPPQGQLGSIARLGVAIPDE